MTYIGDMDYWDEKFKKRDLKLMEAEASVVKYSELLKLGSILDLACGDGRNSIYLSEKGFEVTAIDFSNSALKRLEYFAHQKNISIETAQEDLAQPHKLVDLSVYDNVLLSHYKLKQEELAELKNHIRSEGILIITGFGHKQICDDHILKEDLIYKDDFIVLKDAFELLNYEETIDERGFISTYVFQKI